MAISALQLLDRQCGILYQLNYDNVTVFYSLISDKKDPLFGLWYNGPL